MRSGLSALFVSFTFAGCLAENPGDEGSGATSGDTDDTSADDTTATPVSDNMIGCPSGATCWVVLAAQTLDDRVEIFGAPAGTTPAYRGAIDLDLKPGTEVGPLDEPFGMVLSGAGLHVIAGHYPETAAGSLITFPSAFFDDREPSLIAVSEYFAGGAFSEGVIETRLQELEPIFALPRTVSGKLLVSVFANDLFASEDTWTQAGKLAVIDPENPSDFAMATLAGLENGYCLGASEIVMLGDDRAAVACDGNEAVAFLDLGDLSGGVGDVAAGVSGTLCDLPYPDGRRTRYLAHDGGGGVLVGVGPSPTNATASQVWSVTPGTPCVLSPIDVADSDGQLGQIVAFGEGHLLLAQGALAPAGERGVKVISSSGVCNTLPWLDDVWNTDGEPISPSALAVSPDQQHLVIGAGATQLGNPQNASYGKVVWATLSGTDDACTMTASPVDLTDGGSGRAPAPTGADPKTWRRAPTVVVITEVEGA